MQRLIPYFSLLFLLPACKKEDPIVVDTNNVILSISAPYNDEVFRQGYTVSVDGYIQAEKYISGYEVIFVNENTQDTLDHYLEEYPFNFFTVHHHWTNNLSASARMNIIVNALDSGEVLATTQLSVYCKE